MRCARQHCSGGTALVQWQAPSWALRASTGLLAALMTRHICWQAPGLAGKAAELTHLRAVSAGQGALDGLPDHLEGHVVVGSPPQRLVILQEPTRRPASQVCCWRPATEAALAACQPQSWQSAANIFRGLHMSGLRCWLHACRTCSHRQARRLVAPDAACHRQASCHPRHAGQQLAEGQLAFHTGRPGAGQPHPSLCRL